MLENEWNAVDGLCVRFPSRTKPFVRQKALAGSALTLEVNWIAISRAFGAN